jgi:flagellar motor switch protein FliM
MSTETLSQLDIDRLLGGQSKLTPHSAAALDVQVYDWRRPHRVSKERLRTLEAMYERLAKNLEAWLISRVRGQMEIRLQSVEQFSFGEFTLSLPTPCSSFVFEVVGTGQKGVVDFGPEFSYYVVDRLFGGEGSASIYTRALTPIERMAVQSVADRVTMLLQEIWQDHVAMDLHITAFESSPEILQIANREDPVLVANIEINAGAATSLVLICLPFSVLDKFFTSSGQQRMVSIQTSDLERETTRQRSEASLRSTSVPLSARLPEFQLSMRDIARLEVGSVIPTGIPKDARVIVSAGTQERFIGHPGRASGNLAVRVLDTVHAAPIPPDQRTPSAGTPA